MGSTHPARRRCPLHITIVSDNSETVDGLEAYLQRAGITINGTKHVEKLAEMTPPVASVALIFPDDFNFEAVMAALATLRANRPGILPVLVTKEPSRFSALLAVDVGVVPLVVPKPAWGWTILYTIRARLDADHPENWKIP